MSTYIEQYLKEETEKTSEETTSNDSLLLNEFNDIFSTETDASKQTRDIFKLPEEDKTPSASALTQKRPTLGNIFTVLQ